MYMYIYRTTVLGLAGVDDRRRDAPSREPQPGPCPAWAHRSHYNGRCSTVARDAASDGDEDTATRPWQQRRHLQLSCCAGATARAGQHASIPATPALHIEQKMQDTGWAPDLEQWESDTDSEGSSDEVDFNP